MDGWTGGHSIFTHPTNHLHSRTQHLSSPPPPAPSVSVYVPASIECWRWSGANDAFFRLVRSLEGLEHRGDEALMLGGGSGAGAGYALRIARDGQTGTTAACETFGSPSLLPPPTMPESTDRNLADEEVGGAGNGSYGEQPAEFSIATMELLLVTDCAAL